MKHNLNLSSNIKSLSNISNKNRDNNENSNSVFNEIDLSISQNINFLNSIKKIIKIF